MNNLITKSLADFTALFYPRCCAGCNHVLLNQEKFLCTSCLFHLPITDFHLDAHNQTANQLLGKFSFEHAASMLTLSKDSSVENILYKIKYNNKPDLAFYFGHWYGNILNKVNYLNDADAIIPIPLHRKKLKKRGYNQALVFAEGLADSMNKPILDEVLVRNKASVSQTKKSRLERYENVSDVFVCMNENEINGKHIILVDDVLTTGATLTAAAERLIEHGARISILTLARA